MVLKVLLKIIKIRDRTIFDPACFRFTAIDNISSYGGDSYSHESDAPAT